MTRPVHLSGMGLVGSLLALRMADEGIAFTWDDPGKTLVAFRASTGCCYPSDHPLDAENYGRFAAEVCHHPFLGSRTLASAYGFCSDKAPHYNRAARAGPLLGKAGTVRVLRHPSYHVDVSALVKDTRRRFAVSRRHQPPEGSLRVHSHGFHAKFGLRFLWGWHVRAALRLSDRLRRVLGGKPLCLNLQHMRYGAWYAYPRAGNASEHYLGTSLIAQSQPRPLVIKEKLGRMVQHLREATAGELRLTDVVPGSEQQGWRPQPAEQNGPAAVFQDDAIWLRPQYASGWRHHLTVWDQFRRLVRAHLRH